MTRLARLKSAGCGVVMLRKSQASGERIWSVQIVRDADAVSADDPAFVVALRHALEEAERRGWGDEVREAAESPEG